MAVLYIIACGGRPAGDLAPFVKHAQAAGWQVCVVATPSAMKFLDAPDLAKLTGYPVRSDYKRPEEPDLLPWPPTAVIVAPATFNTINKWAAGISDTLALGLLNEAACLHLPIVAVPFPNQALATHPAFVRSVALQDWGVRLVLDPERYPLPTPNLGPASRDLFPWEALRQELARLTEQAIPPA
jgi:phosphopantothenoylcysteine synthetase/decarboxylase